ncbi:MAG: Ig-like domain-containing protein, partial [Acidobacteriia bacterium]|nr:Ig-like domain-containing protein [Terriglobia bacterium]
IAGVVHNVVYLATMQNTVFAFDADDPNASTPLWKTPLGAPVVNDPPYLPRMVFSAQDGILSTPAIDPNSQTLYVVALTQQTGGLAYELHALDMTTGSDKPGSPVTIQGSVAGNGYDSQNGVVTFNPDPQLQRAGLLLAYGNVYVAFASYGDTDPYHGWIFAYNASTLQQVNVFNVSPGQRGGVWQSGGGMAADGNGFVYVNTGNGTWDGITNFGESFLKLSSTLAVVDYFTPDFYASLNTNDLDIGAARPLLIPGTDLIVSGGKQGAIYLVNRDNMGHLQAGNGQIPESFGEIGHGIHSGLAYWNNSSGGMLYVLGARNDNLNAYRMSNGTFGTTPVSTSAITANYATGLSVSANGSTPGTGIVWAADPGSNALYAFDASNVATELWNSSQNATRDSPGSVAKFAPPVAVNGKVYVATFSNQLAVYGLLPSATLSVAPAAVTLGTSQVEAFSANTPGSTWTITPAGAGSISSTGTYTAPASITAQQTITVTATNGGSHATATVTLVPVSVTVTPSSPTLFASQTQQFSAAVTGSSNNAVTWSLNPPGVGTVSSTGLYTAPAVISQNVTVIATSVADPTKSAGAAVTLNPIVAPSITQQPRSATAVAGQTATFTVAATGGNLAAQWQIKLPGAPSFTNIAGATSATYTRTVALSDNGAQLQCVISNSAGQAITNPVTLTVLPLGANFLVSAALGTPRNDFTGFVGMAVTVGTTPIVVNTLGRMAAPGNSGAHTVKIFDPNAGADIAGSSLSLNMAGVPANTWVYQPLPAPITLNAGATYYFLTQETSGGDKFYNDDTAIQTTSDGFVPGAIYATGQNSYGLAPASGNFSYGPVDFRYSSFSISPASAPVQASQTLQLTVNASGLSSNSATWTLSPNIGTISSTGLYTPPALIPTQTTITVTATSTVDNTKSATASIILTPVAVTLAPTNVTLFSSQQQQFTPTVTGTSNTAVTWSIPTNAPGTISQTGLYSAPSSPITSSTTVTVTATSVADTTKSGTALVTLSPPVPPTITQQPVSATVLAGQTATFSIMAIGGSLAYQWQSLPQGGGSFSNIAGATSSSYTTPAALLTSNATQFRCIVTNSAGTTSSSGATLTVVASGMHFISAPPTTGTPRSNFGGWVGMSVTVGSSPITVVNLGRYVLSGNTQTHTVKIVDASKGNDLQGASTSINTALGTAGQFAYGALVAPVTLNANATYYILSQETAGGDQWYDSDTTAQTMNIAALNFPEFGPNGGPYTPVASLPGHLYGPVDFSIPIGISVTPATVTLSDGQTQQFTATVSGSNQAVTWSISPASIGSISASGLYTAPSPVPAAQTVTVTATSVADPTKSATATVALSLPGPPSITQQPQSIGVFVGQQATFSVTAGGGV